MESSGGSEARHTLGVIQRRRELLDIHQNAERAELSDDTRDAISAARDAGLSMEEIAEALGVSRQRAYALRQERPKPAG